MRQSTANANMATDYDCISQVITFHSISNPTLYYCPLMDSIRKKGPILQKLYLFLEIEVNYKLDLIREASK